MFGKKEKADKPAKPAKAVKEKAPARVKTKKAKASSGKSGPNFFAAHVEKLILGLVVAATGYVIYAGISGKGYPTDREPTGLNQSAGQVLQQISEDHTSEIFAERKFSHAFVAEVEKARRDIDPQEYAVGSLQESSTGPRELRGDPKILAPEQLVVKCVSGAIAIEVPIETSDPFEVFEDAPRITATRRPSRGSNNREIDEEDEDKIKPPARRLMAKYDLGAAIGAMAGGMGMGMGMEGGMGGMGGGMGGMGGGMGGMGGGMESGMGGGMGGAMGGMGGGMGGAGAANSGGLGQSKNIGPKTKVASQGAIFVAATALVKHKEMSDEYERQFKNSGDYVLSRDTPVYLTFEIERADVSKNPSRDVQDNEWKRISDGTKQIALQKNWATKPPLGRPVPEVIDRNARHPGLTMPIPPLLIKDYRDFSKHPAIAWVWDTKRLIAPPKRDDKKKDAQTDEDILPGQAAGVGMAGGMGGMGMGGMGMEGGMGMGMGGMGMGGMGGMEGGMGGMGMEGGMGMGMGGMGEGGMGMDGMGGMEGGMGGMGGMMGGMGGGMGGMGMTMSAGPQPDYKMLRFYDMLTPQDVGKVYRYRVRLVMRDPNYPERIKRPTSKPGEFVDYDIPGPQPTTLEKEVFDRITEQRRIDDVAYKADSKARRKMLETDWSEPSLPIRISARLDAFAGLGYDPASNPRPSAVLAESEANIVATWMDPATGVTYAKAFNDARRGSVLNAKKENIEFVVPASRVVKHRDWQFSSNSIVVDMRGGEELGASSRRDGDPLAASGEVMVILGDGSVQITNDIDDTFEYRMYTFADEYENAKKMGTSGGTGMGGEGGMMGGMEGGMGGGMGGMGSDGPGGPGGRGGRGGGR